MSAVDELPSWFIRQLNLEPEPIAPRLPPELLQQILPHALHDQAPAMRQKTRGRFRRVCKDWNDSVDFWKEVDVVGSARLHYLARHFVRCRVGGKKKVVVAGVRGAGEEERVVRKPWLEVRRMYLELDDVDEGGWSLLGVVSEVERLEIMSIEGWYLDSTDGGADRTARAQVTEFRLGGPVGTAGEWPVVGLGWVKEVIPHWPHLRVLALDRCEIHPLAEPPSSPLVDPRSNPDLRSITARSFGTDDAVREFISGLNTNINELILGDAGTYVTHLWSPTVNATLPAIATDLTSLTLVDSPLDAARLPTARGVYDTLIPHLNRAKKLVVNVCAVSRLSLLLTLPALAELELVTGTAVPATLLACNEVLDYLGRQKGLQKLTLSEEVMEECPEAAWEELDKVAEGRGVRLEWED